MKLKLISQLIRGIFRPAANTTTFLGNVMKPPAGMVPDAGAVYGLFGLMANIDALDYDIVAVPIATATTVTLTGAQLIAGITDISGSPGSGVTMTTPTAAQIIAALPNTIPGDGINLSIYIMNDGTGQTITLSGGTGVTIIGNNTIATNTCRQFIMNVNVNSAAVNMLNIGTQNL
jgi:hypothetical protein